MAMHARKSREHEALFTVALNFWVGYLYPPIRKQQPGGRALSKENSKDMDSKDVNNKDVNGKEKKGEGCLQPSATHCGIRPPFFPRSLAAETELIPRSHQNMNLQ